MFFKNKNNIKDIELAYNETNSTEDQKDINWEKMKNIFSIKSFQECSTLR